MFICGKDLIRVNVIIPFLCKTVNKSLLKLVTKCIYIIELYSKATPFELYAMA